MSDKVPKIGLKQAKLLCGMPHNRRLAFIAEGMPKILKSAQAYWDAASQLGGMGRESGILEGLASEEASKILILMDVVRCPKKRVGSKIGILMGWFYDHLARLAYVEAASWKPVDTIQLKDYMVSHLKSHYVEGEFGEFIMPNWALFRRENQLYVDIAADDNSNPYWSSPLDFNSFTNTLKPTALLVAESMSALGFFKQKSLKVVSDIWSGVEFNDIEGYEEVRELTRSLLDRMTADNLIPGTATQEDVNYLYRNWQFPMYDFDLKQIAVTLDELKAEQGQLLWAEMS